MGTKAYFSFLLSILLSSFFLCIQACTQDASPIRSPAFPYDVTEPTESWYLPMVLQEVSGLSWDARRNQLIAIQDENGYLFYLHDGQIEERVEFWKDGDYEGVEVVGNEVFVVKSSGTLYQIQHPGSPDQKVEKFNDFLDPGNDVEGLAYDREKHRLLLACKGKAGEGEAFELKKAVYAFDLNPSKMELEKDPVYVISLEDVRDFLNMSPALRKWENLMDKFQPNDTHFTFTPSGIAVTPDGEYIYILSTAGRFILILDSQTGAIVHIEKLKKKNHRQPEGICFDSLSNLYISNEGSGASPTLYRYAPRAD
jgi:uncharacterized protein YjiK